MAEYLRGWLDIKKLKVRPNTWRGYCDHVEQLIPILGDTKLSELQAPEIARCINQLRESGRRDGTGGLSGTSVQHILRTLNTALRAAVKSRKIVRNPVDDLDDDEKPRRERVELVVWTAEELARFLARLLQLHRRDRWARRASPAVPRDDPEDGNGDGDAAVGAATHRLTTETLLAAPTRRRTRAAGRAAPQRRACPMLSIGCHLAQSNLTTPRTMVPAAWSS
jgi:hypothetical protein